MGFDLARVPGFGALDGHNILAEPYACHDPHKLNSAKFASYPTGNQSVVCAKGEWGLGVRKSPSLTAKPQ